MSAEELLDEAAARMVNANRLLLEMADAKRGDALATDFHGIAFSLEASRLEAKAEGVRLALSYLNDVRRLA